MLTRLKVALSRHISIVWVYVFVCVCVHNGPKGVWFECSCEKPQCLNHHIFGRAAPNFQDCAGEDKKSPVNFRIRHTPCEPRPQAKPFEGLHTAGSLRNVDKRATVNYCYQIILPLWVLNNGGPISGRRRPTLRPHGMNPSLFLLWRSQTDAVLWCLLTKNTAKWSCGWPICKYGPCQPNCSPCWQWLEPKNSILPKEHRSFFFFFTPLILNPWGWFETRQGVIRQNR